MITFRECRVYRALMESLSRNVISSFESIIFLLNVKNDVWEKVLDTRCVVFLSPLNCLLWQDESVFSMCRTSKDHCFYVACRSRWLSARCYNIMKVISSVITSQEACFKKLCPSDLLSSYILLWNATGTFWIKIKFLLDWLKPKG